MALSYEIHSFPHVSGSLIFGQNRIVLLLLMHSVLSNKMALSGTDGNPKSPTPSSGRASLSGASEAHYFGESSSWYSATEIGPSNSR